MHDISDKKVPVVRIDTMLDQYDGKVVFPEKLAKANARLAESGFPKVLLKKKGS